jgi:hypothetical protein
LHLPGHRKKLLREGARADAVVTGREAVNLTYGGFSAYELVLEVHFPDGSRAELREQVDAADLGRLHGQVGDVLPVRYDPENPSEMVVDVPAIQAQNEEEGRRLDQEAVARGRRSLEGDGGAPPEQSQLQGVLGRLAELTELRRELDAGRIEPDEYQRRRREIAAADEPG